MFGFGRKKDLKEMTDVIDQSLTMTFFFMNDIQELLFNELDLDFKNDEKLIKEIVVAYHCFSSFMIECSVAAVKDKSAQNELFDYLIENTYSFRGLERMFVLKNEAKSINIDKSFQPFAIKVTNHFRNNFTKFPINKEIPEQGYCYMNTKLIQELIGGERTQKQNDLIYQISAVVCKHALLPSIVAFMNINNQ